MKIPNDHRMSVVRELLEQTRPLGQTIHALSLFDWDYEGPKLVLSKSHLENALEKFINGNLSAAEIENWANSIEGREDIEYKRDEADQIDSALFELANPLLTQELNFVRAQQLLTRMSGKGEGSL